MDSRTPAALVRMRLIATGLLIAMTALFLVSLGRHEAGWGYVGAFAEAAMVGGLADWFAVTAIFRRPLGLPIPHTAVIPRSKARIADALGEFVAVNFLAAPVVAERLASIDLAAGLGRQISDPVAAKRIADGVIDAAPGLVDLLDDAVVADFLRRQIAEFSGDARLSTALGSGLKMLTDQGRHQPVLDAALQEGWRALEQHEDTIRAQVRARTGWLWRLISLDARAADALIAALEQTLRDVSQTPDHPARQRVTELLNKFSDDLQHSPELRTQIQHVVSDMLSHPAVGAYLSEVWGHLRDAIRAGAESPDSEIKQALADAIVRLGAALSADAEVRAAMNHRLRAFLVEVSSRHGGDVAHLISETIRGWDTKTVVQKLEHNVGRDLQYIRINGTLIGGLVGLAIHQLTLWLAH